jgi:hypothetical protein
MCEMHGFSKMSGHGFEIGGLHELTDILAAMMAARTKKKPKTYEQFIQEAIDRLEADKNAAEASLSILKAKMDDGVKIVGLESFKLSDDPLAALTIATYEMPDGGFQIVGRDHTKPGEEHIYTTPNVHGVDGLIEAIRNEFVNEREAAHKAADAPAESGSDSEAKPDAAPA